MGHSINLFAWSKKRCTSLSAAAGFKFAPAPIWTMIVAPCFLKFSYPSFHAASGFEPAACRARRSIFAGAGRRSAAPRIDPRRRESRIERIPPTVERTGVDHQSLSRPPRARRSDQRRTTNADQRRWHLESAAIRRRSAVDPRETRPAADPPRGRDRRSMSRFLRRLCARPGARACCPEPIRAAPQIAGARRGRAGARRRRRMSPPGPTRRLA